MGWKQIAKSNDLIILEKNLKNYKIKIEARKNNDMWEVFKTKIKGDKSTLISEYKVTNKELKEYLKKLKKSNPEIEKKQVEINPKHLIITLKRSFKEEFTEKWQFSIENYDKNFVLLNFENDLNVDIVMHKKYQLYENQILNQLRNNLGFEELGSNIYIKIYYFDETNYYSEESDGFFSIDSDYE